MNPRQEKKCRFQVETLEGRIALSSGFSLSEFEEVRARHPLLVRSPAHHVPFKHDVLVLQQALTELGYHPDLGQSGVDGRFGPSTKRAVEHFQGDAVSGVFGKKFDVGAGRRGVDGKVGDKTWAALDVVLKQFVLTGRHTGEFLAEV